MAAWKLPLIVAALAVPVVAAFAVGGAAAGVAAGALVTAALLVVAARQTPRGPIGGAPEEGGRKVLLVVTRRVDEPVEVDRVAVAAGLGATGDDASVLVLSPLRTRFLDRWASDVEGARRAAQEDLVATVAALAKAGIAAEARVGDEDVVQAVEDQLGSFAASEVVLVSDGGEEVAAAATELGARLRPAFRRVVLGDG
ncbi:MAG TPA: hypothetical protein VIS95_09685 [Solirubrobacterales bacterium]